MSVRNVHINQGHGDHSVNFDVGGTLNVNNGAGNFDTLTNEIFNAYPAGQPTVLLFEPS